MRLNKWDYRFLDLAKHIGQWSRDPSTQVGCVITDTRKRIVGTGFNGFPAGVRDTDERLLSREIKLAMTQHAERNAIAFATRQLDGCIAYVWPLPPCAQCAGALIQAGITRVVSPELPKTHERWGPDIDFTLAMYEEAGVQVDFYTQKNTSSAQLKRECLGQHLSTCTDGVFL